MAATFRHTVNQILDQLPDDATLEDLQYHLYVRQKIEKSLKQADDGNLIDHEEVERRIAPWIDDTSPSRSWQS